MEQLTKNQAVATSQERSEERFSRNAETELVCRLLLEKKNRNVPKAFRWGSRRHRRQYRTAAPATEPVLAPAVFFLMIPPPPKSTLFPYTTLFRSDMDLAAKGLGAKEWNNSLKTKLSLLPKKLFRIRMSRNFGMKMLTMTNLSTECLIQLTKLGYDATPFNQILKQNAKREMRL